MSFCVQCVSVNTFNVGLVELMKGGTRHSNQYKKTTGFTCDYFTFKLMLVQHPLININVRDLTYWKQHRTLREYLYIPQVDWYSPCR